MGKKLYIIFREFGKKLQRDNVGAYASSISFFFLLSVVPLLILVCSIVGYTPLSEVDILNGAQYICPDFLDDLVCVLIQQIYDETSTMLPISIIVLIWSAGKAMWGLMMGLNNANGVEEKRNTIVVRIWASVYSLVMLVALLFSLAMVLMGDNFVNYIRFTWPNLAIFLRDIGRFRFILVWGFLSLWFMILYTVVPNIKLRLLYQMPGAMLAAAAWSLFSYCFAIYVDYFDGFNIYGSLSSLVLVMMWLYVNMYILLIGANLNRYFGSFIKLLFQPRNRKNERINQ